MKKIIITFIFSLIFIAPFPSFAFEPFTPISSNPLTISSQYPRWNETGILQGQAIMESNNSFSLWYSSLGNGIRIAKATSPDGLSWTGNSIYNFLGNQDTSDPYFIKNNPNYLYFATTPTGNTTRIMRITEVNDTFDNSTIQEVLIPEKKWGVNGTTSPVVWIENGTYYLFYSALETTWNMGMATSKDGITFTECNNNPFLSGDTVPRSIIKLNNEYYLFFHSPQGLGYVKTSTLVCNTVWSARTFLGLSGYFPSIILIPDVFRLYYGSPAGGIWKLYLATSSIPAPNPTPTSTPSPSPTPTMQPKRPIIIIPGLFASWNKEALIHEAQVSQTDWHLNPMVKEYQGLEKTLQNVGYEKNKDYFFFTYDWRKPIEQTADELKIFIDNIHTSSVNIFGHSLGGLIGRVYIQKYGSSQIDKLVTIGSPHLGTTNSYRAVEAGEMGNNKDLMWLVEKIILQKYRNGLQTDREIIAQKLPVMQNLFPLTDFLIKNGNKISLNQMKITNNSNLLKQTPSPKLLHAIQTIGGNKGPTLSGFEVQNPTTLDQLLNLYPDGRPTKELFEAGDYTITSKSSSLGGQPITLMNDHGELVYTKLGIQTILDAFSISYTNDQIVEGSSTKLTPSLFFLMMSPAKLQVVFGNKTYDENDAMLFIENAENGTYELRAIGQEKGRYTILIGQLTPNNDIWNKIEGEITQDPPSSQTDTYQITFHNQFLESPLTFSTDIFNELILYLTDLNKTLAKNEITKTISNISSGKQYELNKGKLKSYLLIAHQQLFLAYQKADVNGKDKILYGIEKLENLYNVLLDGYNLGIVPARLKQGIADAKKQISPLQSYLLLMKHRGKTVQKNALQLIEIEKKLNLAQEAFSQKRYPMAEIYLKSAQEMIKDVRKI